MDTSIRLHRSPPTIMFGPGSVGKIGPEARKYGTKVLIVTDRGVSACGTLDSVVKPLVDAGCAVSVYDHAIPEPPMASLAELIDLVRNRELDLVIGFGGGSALDVAKMTAALAGNEGSVADYVGIDQIPHKGLPIFAVPTTAGTGSEVTAIAIFSNEEKNVKQGVVSPHIMPDAAFVDPLLTATCPPGVTSAAGMDALIHNIEAYISVNATPITDALALQGIELIGRSLRTAVFDGGNLDARADVALGALLGGMAFANAGVGAVHALSYPLGGRFHVAHGTSNTVMLPWVMEFNLPATLPRFARVAAAMGERLEGLSLHEAAEKGLAAMRLIACDIGAPQYLSDVNVPAEAIEEMADGAMGQTRLLSNNPRKLTKEEVLAIYRNAAIRPAGEHPILVGVIPQSVN